MLPKIIADNLTPLVLDQGDVSFLMGLDGTVTEDKINLPSGRVIDPPPSGTAWEISNGMILKKICEPNSN